MNNFPDEFNRGSCMKELKKNQSGIILEVRKEFYEKALESIKRSDRVVSFDFPDKLWQENRLKITKELLGRFGILKVSVPGENYVTTKTASDEDELPNNIKSIKIEFFA